ncbi:MAG: phosphotransferase [Candidatus Heimdallarchaeota archaeon]|nr:phosphotransferase [Candidatus Heimdallarchaeota archaeon]MCK4770265.1 phosphotransferase [Candidatus Heimdallarchaeota archaeon]
MAVGEREKEKLSEVLIRKILNNHYDIGKIESITHLEEGHESDNSKVETDRGEFAIKLLYHDEESAQRKMVALDLLTSHGVKAPKPIKTIKNEYYAIYKTNIPIMVTSFIQGKPIAFRETGEHFKHMKFFGKQIGIYHRISKSIPHSKIEEHYKHEEIHDNSLQGSWVMERYEEADKILPNHEKNEKILKSYEQWIDTVEETIEKETLSKGIVHGDLFPGAFFVNEDKLTGILDFGGGYWYLMGDLGTWVMYTELEKPKHKNHFKEFIVPYLNQSGLSIEELKIIPLFYRARGYVQYFYFAWRCYHNLTHGLEEGETNMEGFLDGIEIVEKTIALKQDYFYDLAVEALKEEK